MLKSGCVVQIYLSPPVFLAFFSRVNVNVVELILYDKHVTLTNERQFYINFLSSLRMDRRIIRFIERDNPLRERRPVNLL